MMYNQEKLESSRTKLLWMDLLDPGVQEKLDKPSNVLF